MTSWAGLDRYAHRLQIGTVKEIAVQTEPPTKCNYEFETILGHKTEGTKMGVRFHVKLKGYNVKVYRNSKFIIEHGAEAELVKYLNKLQNNESTVTRFDYMLANQPDLLELLKE